MDRLDVVVSKLASQTKSISSNHENQGFKLEYGAALNKHESFVSLNEILGAEISFQKLGRSAELAILYQYGASLIADLYTQIFILPKIQWMETTC